ncbi:hypothetical protein ESY86_15395 [Subsaximicrobium wynnwilliamsii]|uniref:TonB-dependent receptor plug domain-containing protein n=1 Tax=Subsaximicrobium wynnwilliamsii TaxID=291179 RepID=A0A5C6ZG49_9FLAO|nr:hypothetical protein [Subsaximicrobium wynnwilliamsii]TXD82214.1 hypothetical protein ESY87_14985 [Subsaximicrobium wynnwilliamsii]TXD87854.1 hypothetical protein ESY86_15395 [Subsaximicrobium wynnwilliamsii]TXE01804.1 hypothetical protein ESY88_14560 [Subsaximicrobium wynnwilliamsii]
MHKPLTFRLNRNFSIAVFLFCFSLFSFLVEAQTANNSLLDNFQAYTKLPREVTYGHLNKSTLIKGETLGFAIYVYDKNLKAPSNSTTNIYCSLENESGEVLKKSLILAENGVANGVFEIDSLFDSGNYIFKAYSNWMKNFNEQNFYIENLKIINPEDYKKEVTTNSQDIDVQFLPEGGHLIANVNNSIGVTIKNNLGYGIPNLSAGVYDNTGTEITNFKTNALGLGKFSIKPVDQERYTVKIKEVETPQINLSPAESIGLNLKLTDLGNRVALSIRTNPETLSQIESKPYKLSIHNGNLITIVDFNFGSELEVTKVLNYENLFEGINIFTVFNEDGQPILERLFFKYDGIGIVKSETIVTKREPDSVVVTVPFEAAFSEKFSSLSVSILPEHTKSNNNHQNIISQVYLQPYVRGFIENAKYYFQDIDRQKKYELDMLLLTQGWSSYDWTNVFSHTPEVGFEFENGISFKANTRNSKEDQFVVYPLKNSPTVMTNIKEGQKSFEVKGLLPEDDEKINIGGISNRENVNKPSIYLQFYPSKVPSLEKYAKFLPVKENRPFEGNENDPILVRAFEEIQALDEVVITAQKEVDRIEKITRRHNGRVDVFDDIQRNSFIDFASYISSRGFVVNQTATDLNISTARTISLNASRTPLIYMDNFLLNDFSILLNYDMANVDYIVIDKSGLGEGMRGAAGVIKIFTDPRVMLNSPLNRDVTQIVDIPLTFTSPKKFYTPKYTYYRSNFFQNYGVIGWEPKLKIDSNGNLNFKIPDTGNERLKLFIEGVANDDEFVTEEKTIVIN